LTSFDEATRQGYLCDRGRGDGASGIGVRLIERVKQDLEPHAVVEQYPKMEGRQCHGVAREGQEEMKEAVKKEAKKEQERTQERKRT